MHKEIQRRRSVAGSYMRKGFLVFPTVIYEEMRKYLVIYEEVVSHTVYDFAPDPFWISLYKRKIFFSFLSVSQVSNGCFIEDQAKAFSPSYELAPPSSLSPISKFDRPHPGKLGRRDNVLTGGGGDGGSAKSYDCEKAWSSMKHLVLCYCAYSVRRGTSIYKNFKLTFKKSTLNLAPFFPEVTVMEGIKVLYCQKTHNI